MAAIKLLRKPFRLSRHPKTALAIGIFLLGAIMGVLTQEELYRNFLFALFAWSLLFPCLLVLSIIALVTKLMGWSMGAALSWPTVIVASSLISVTLFMAVGGGLNKWKIAAVESYVDRAVPVLDQMRTRDGSYPTTLPVSVLGEPPELLRQYGDYTSNGSGYYFEYLDEPAGWAGGEGLLKFDCFERKWTYEE